MKNTPIIIVIAFLTSLVLYSFGRELWCPAGDLLPWSFDLWSRHNSQHLLDWYTPSHISHGLLFALLLRAVLSERGLKYGLSAAVLLESGWEILENSSFIINRYRESTIALDYFGDSILNSLSDVMWCMLGYRVAVALPAWKVLSIFLAFELITLVFIRDNLTLNVIMLIWPIEAIKTWQMGA
jgi:hypothetical protein